MRDWYLRSDLRCGIKGMRLVVEFREDSRQEMSMRWLFMAKAWRAGTSGRNAIKR